MARARRHQHRSLAGRFPAALITAALPFWAASASENLIEPLSQARSVFADASADLDFDRDSASAVAFEPFEASVDAAAFGEESSASASAYQRSQIGTDSVTGQGDADAFASDFMANASADSDFDLSFTIRTALEYSFDASVIPDAGAGAAMVSLYDVARETTVSRVDTSGQTHVMATGRLDPGEYRIQAYASAMDVGFGANTGFTFSLTVPEPRVGLLQLSAIATLAALGLAQRRSRSAFFAAAQRQRPLPRSPTTLGDPPGRA